ncbi:MAG: type VII secretion protein EssC, partial [Oscillospiraceae bacterium]
YKSLAVPLGVRAKDDYVYLDLHEKAHGPHGLVAGTTGSGKSEILQSYILSLAVNFHPHEVGFLLIDYKGGGMANLFNKLPHLLGTITNLDGSESMRALASIKSELARRQRIFNEYGVNNINQYTKMFKAGEANKPLPHLFLISDEFAELKKEQPDFMTELVSAARIGRSLGVHLILATQKPTGVVDDQIWSNSRFKLALKVQDESDSKEVLKTPDAARITQPGRAYLQVGNNEIYELFQSAWSGATYSETIVKQGFDSRVYLINSLGQGQLLNHDLSSLETESNIKLTQLDAVVDHINTIYQSMDALQVEKPWLPPLADKIVTSHLADVQNDTGKLQGCDLSVPLGIVDIPERQEQMEYVHDFISDGNLAVFGASGFGKSTMEMTIALTLASKNSSSLMHYYVLDYGNSSLIQLRLLPHTADYLTFDDNEKLKKLVKHLMEEMRRRKLLFAKTSAMNFKMYNSLEKEKIPAIMVFIDNYDVVKEIGTEFEEFLIKLTRDGVGVGIYTVISASRINVVRYAVINNFKNKIAQFMFDPTEITAVVGRSNYKLTEIKGRALVKLDSVSIMQSYLPVAFESENDYVHEIGKVVRHIETNNTAPRAEEIKMLPEILSYVKFFKAAKNGDRQVAVGMDTEDVEVQYIDMNMSKHLIIGTPQTGKTNLLKLIFKQCIAEKVFISDSRGYDLQDLEQEENSVYVNSEVQITEFAFQLEKLLEQRKDMFSHSNEGMRPRDFYAKLPVVLMLIDDADRFVEICKPIEAHMEKLLEQAVECGVCIIATTLPSRLRGYDNITKALKDTQSGIVLGNAAEQSVFMVQAPRNYRQQVDMGFLYCRGGTKMVKIPLAP